MGKGCTRHLGIEHYNFGVQSRVPFQTSSDYVPDKLRSAIRSRTQSSNISTSGKPAAEKGDRSGVQTPNTRVLQQVFHSPKEGARKLASYFGSGKSEHFHCQENIQDGNTRVHKITAPSGGMGHFSRPLRCLSPYPNPSKVQEVLEIPDRRQNLPIQSPTYGIDRFCTGVHKSSANHQGNSTERRDKAKPVPRRLAHTWHFQRASQQRYSQSSGSGTTAGVSSELAEVRSYPTTTVHFPGIPLRSGSGSCKAHAEQDAEARTGYHPFPAQSSTVRTPLADSYWHHGSNRKDGTKRHDPNEGFSVGTGTELGSIQWESRQVDHRVKGSSKGSSVVARREECTGGSAPTSAFPRATSLHRCFTDRLGGIPATGRDTGERQLGSRRSVLSHKRQRAASSTVCPITTEADREEALCPRDHRQFLGCCVHKQTGRNTIHADVEGNREIVPLVRRTRSAVELQTHPRPYEHYSRQPITCRPSEGNGVDPGTSSDTRFMADMGEATHRPVCHSTKPPIADLCLSCPRLSSSGSRCTLNVLDEHVCVCLPTNSDLDESAAEINGGNELHIDSDRPSLAQTTMVSSDAGTANRSSSPASKHQETVETDAVSHFPSQPRHFPTPRVEIIKQQSRARGFSEKVSLRLAKPQKDSTIAVYEGKWRIFCDWCESRNRNPLHTDVVVLGDFLVWLREVKDLATSTIEGYRTAIASTLLGTSGVDLGKDLDLSRLLANLARERPKSRACVPKWNLATVLEGLTKHPFEPLHTASLKLVTLKTAFLLAFASGRRRGELHALVRTVSHKDNWSKVVLHTDPSFVAKTELANSSQVMQPLVIPALDSQDTTADSNLSLCPVRALRIYLDRTETLRGDREKLFISFKKGSKGEIAKATISQWIKKAVVASYELAGEEGLQDSIVRAHDVRGFAASWARCINVPLDEIMAACTWRSHNTFTHFYLKDLSLIQDDLLQLCPLVAAQHIVK